MSEEYKTVELKENLGKELCLDELEAVVGGVQDMETDPACDGSDGPPRYVREPHPSPVPRRRQR